MKIPLFLVLGSLLLPGFSQSASAQCSTGNITCVGSDCTTIGAVEYAYGSSSDNFTFNSFQGNTNAGKNSITDLYYANGSVTTKSGFARVGNDSIKHQIWGPDESGESGKRAELTSVEYSHSRKDASGNAYYYWYGWSYYIPNDSNWSSSTLEQYIGQWRWSNIGGCVTQKYCDGSTIGGSGHHLYYTGGKVSFDMELPDTSCSTSGRLKLVKTTLTSAITKGVWVDFIMQAKWISDSTGSVKIWMQTDGGGYSNKMNYSGPTWVGKYVTSTSCSYSGQDTGAPNWTLGLYASNDKPSKSTPRIMFTDEPLMYRTLCSTTTGSEGWYKVLR
jgi:hypothetical protein